MQDGAPACPRADRRPRARRGHHPRGFRLDRLVAGASARPFAPGVDGSGSALAPRGRRERRHRPSHHGGANGRRRSACSRISSSWLRVMTRPPTAGRQPRPATTKRSNSPDTPATAPISLRRSPASRGWRLARARSRNAALTRVRRSQSPPSDRTRDIGDRRCRPVARHQSWWTSLSGSGTPPTRRRLRPDTPPGRMPRPTLAASASRTLRRHARIR